MPTRYFMPRELGEARSFVAQQAERAGISPERRHDLVVAANEIVTNVFKFAGPTARVRLWTESDRLVCEVTDEGVGIADPSPGWVLARPDQITGRGLWLARQLSDRLDLRTGPGGTSIKMSVRIDEDDRALAS
jgi:serine/threonine-protein kinase RsbW